MTEHRTPGPQTTASKITDLEQRVELSDMRIDALLDELAATCKDRDRAHADLLELGRLTKLGNRINLALAVMLILSSLIWIFGR